MKKVTLVAGLAMTFSTALLRAQTREITSYLLADGQDYRGYCIELAQFDQGPGFVTAGSRAADGIRTSVHLMSIMRDHPGDARGQILNFPDYRDVRAIAVAMIGTSEAALLLQTTGDDGVVRPTLVLLDCRNFDNLQVLSATELTDQGLFLFPTSLCVSEDQTTVFVAGYSVDDRTPDFASSKQGFVSSFDIRRQTVTQTKYYDSQRAVNAGADYDMIQRIRFIGDRLYIIGSVNDAEPRFGASRTWVAQIEAGSLGLLQQAMSGNDAFSYPGFQGIDLVPDVNEPDNFYLVGQDYYKHTWTLSRLQSDLKVISGGSTFNNTITYVRGSDIKGYGVIAHADGRISVYGGMRSAFPNIPVGRNIASFNDGAVPFVASFDPKTDPVTGLDASNLSWFNEGNLPTTTTNLNSGQAPYWYSGDLSYWSIPAFAILSEPERRESGLAIMGHVGYRQPNLAPRLIESDANGSVDGCDGSLDVTDQVKPYVQPILLIDAPIEVGETDRNFGQVDVRIEAFELAHDVLNCSDNKYYREATGMAATASGKAALQSLSPNPARDAVTLRWNGAVEAGATLRLELSDVFGRNVGTGRLQRRTDVSGEFALPELVPGIYTARLFVNGQAAGQQKLSIR